MIFLLCWGPHVLCARRTLLLTPNLLIQLSLRHNDDDDDFKERKKGVKKRKIVRFCPPRFLLRPFQLVDDVDVVMLCALLADAAAGAPPTDVSKCVSAV